MEYILHRINSISQLNIVSDEYGVELDLRDSLDGRIHISHEPFVRGEDFEEYLKCYHHGTMILNIKSERIEWKVLELLKQYNIKKYFFLDSSFPMISEMCSKGEKNIALRFSEYEGLDTINNMSGKVKWIWVDCFSKLPLEYDIYVRLKNMGYKLCLVSPELQGQPEKIVEYRRQLENSGIQLDAICTKDYCIEQWRKPL